MTPLPENSLPLTALGARGLAKYAAELLVIGVAYFVLAKVGLTLASIHPSATPIWPPTGLALAAVLLRGLRVWPAIFLAALAANATTAIADATTADSLLTSSAIAVGNTLEAVIGGYLTNIWSGGRRTFDTPNRIAKFALVGLGPGSMVSATIGVGSLSLAGYANWGNFADIWFTWWLGDVAGAVVFAPVLVLWAASNVETFHLDKVLETGTALVAATAVGIIAFSPLIEQSLDRSSLGFLAILPLLWAALRCGQRDTASVALILSGFAIWGTLAGSGPFAGTTLNESFLLMIMFMISTAVPSLALSADVAVKKGVEARLRQREQDLRAMFSQAVVGIAKADATGRFKLVNDRFCEIVQRPAAELMQLRIQDITDPDDLPRTLDFFGHAIETGEGFVIENRYVLPDGRYVWVRNNISAIFDPDDKVRHVLAVSEDVTPRRRAEANLRRAHDDLEREVQRRTAELEEANVVLHTEIQHSKRVEAALTHDIAERRKTQEALLESERRFRLFIQGVTDYAIFMLDSDGYITSWNMGAQRIHQYGAAEIIGRHFSQFYTEEERQRGEPARALQVAAYEGKYVAEGWRVRRDESLFWASVVIEAIRDEVGRPVGFAKITRDITERRAAQAALERAQEQLAQSQKMEALGQLTGSIAHDVNNLLRQPLSPVVVDLKERVEAVREMLVGALRGNVELKCDMPADIWPVQVDIAELELALVNIAVNARDAMPGGGTITLSARNIALKKSDEVDQLEGDFIALAMIDTGVGIAPDILPRIFEPFFTTKALGKGTGLGLPQVYGFAHQSGGTVTAKSSVGGGTAITIYLPRSHVSLTKTAEPIPIQPVVSGQGTILIVEDNAEVAEVTASLVEQLGYRTVRAENATDALGRLQSGDKINLVFSDIVMPGGMNGIALAQEIGNRYPEIPVLLTSGYIDMAQAAETQVAILRKPFQLPTLEKSIREALERGGRVLQFSQWRGMPR